MAGRIGSTGGAGAEAAEDPADRRFVWPPRPLPDAGSPAAVLDPGQGRRRGADGRAGSWLADLETRWLGRPDAGTWARRRLELGLEPEPPEAVCPRCAGGVGPGEVSPEGCGTCRSLRLGWSRAFRLGHYAGELREAVQDLKYRGWRGLGESLGAELGHRLSGALQRWGVRPDEAALVPVPTRRWRRLAVNSGVDHTLALARGAGRASGVRIARALARRPGPSQTGLSATARAENAKRAFRAVSGRLPACRVVVLIDDVRTTGATATACGRLLARLMHDIHGERIGTGRAALSDRVWLATAAVAGEHRRRIG